MNFANSVSLKPMSQRTGALRHLEITQLWTNSYNFRYRDAAYDGHCSVYIT